MDWADVIDLQCQIEDNLDVEIEDERVNTGSLVREVIDYVEELVKAKAA